ncbi:hypothetical protein ANCDUO_05900 [Ancylostoma duodenale]|uniref:Uncharacterized protein n=1 Tax=Ancylostoma duodenale TaxID=51022 RepID=A0A0C2DME7_9BILA|nr:hypothetical protein ANCDUO_05900 [Ancylostoma duodenale]
MESAAEEEDVNGGVRVNVYSRSTYFFADLIKVRKSEFVDRERVRPLRGSLPRLESQSSLKRVGTDQSRLHRSPSMFDKMFGFLLRSNA